MARRVSRLNVQPPYSYVITDDATEMPRSASTFIQSEWARRASPRALPHRSLDRATEQKQLFGQRGFSRIRVEMMAKVRRAAISPLLT